MTGPTQEHHMCFNKSAYALLTLIMPLVLSLVACTPRIGEKPPDNKVLELTATKCLNQSANELSRFFDAKAEDARLEAAWTCIETAFSQFEKYVVGKEQDKYSSQEIVTFLENNFFEDVEKNKLTPEFQKEVMKLKQIFIGGDTEFVTREELRSSKAFLQQISNMTIKINRHMKIIVTNWKPQLDSIKSQDLAVFESANFALQEFAVELAELIAKNPSVYKINDIVVLCREIEKFFSANWDWVRDIENLVPGFKKLKIALASGNENTINQVEWKPVLTLGARGYFQYLRYYYFIKTTSETGGAIRLVYVARTLEDVFSIFQDLVSQKPSGVVTAREVYEILDGFEQFWTDLKVSEKLISEFMKLKQVLIGGSAETWTAVDFEQARLKVPVLRRIAENFMPYFSIYSSEWDPGMEDPQSARETFKLAQIRLATVAQDFGSFLKGAYSFDDLVELVDEINALYPATAAQSRIFSEKKAKLLLAADGSPVNNGRKAVRSSLGQYRDLFLEVKKMVYNEPDTIIQKDQWKEVLPLFANVFSIYQYYNYFLVDKSWKSSQSVRDMDILVNDSSSFMRNLFQASKKGYFTQEQLVNLTIKLSETDLLGQKLSVESTNAIWTALLQHMLFPPERRLAGEKNNRLSMEQITILRTEFSIWAKSQVALNKLFDNDPEKSFAPPALMKNLKDLVQQSQNNPDVKMGVESVYSILDSVITFTWDSEDHLEISNRVEWQYKLNALFQANLTRAITRILLRSFATDVNLNRVNQCETQGAFDLLAGLFRDLNIFDPSPGFISSRFMEANIFMSRGNGDKYLDFNEMAELINVIFSGLRVNDKLTSSLRNICKVHKNAKGKEFVSIKCMSEHHYVMVRKHMTQLPDFKAYVEKLAAKDEGKSQVMRDLEDLTVEMPNYDLSSPQQPPDEQPDTQPPTVEQPTPPQDGGQPPPRQGPRPGFKTWNNVFRQTLRATGWKPNKGYGDVKEESVLFDEALYYPFIVQYTELLYSRFDSSKNGFLQASEAKRAFPTFKPILRELADSQIRKGLIKESDLLSVFTFIMRYKEQPSVATVFKWLSWRNNESKWSKEVYVGRTDIAQILGLIGDKARGEAAPAPVCR